MLAGAMRISQQVQYAICGVFDLAYNGDGRPVQVRVIGERQNIPARYLEQIFQRLRKAKLVSGKRGPGGGYVLGRKPAQISIRDIVEAVEGPVTNTGGEPQGDERRPNFLWPDLARRIGDSLAQVTVEDLCRDAARAAVERTTAASFTYQI